MTFLWIILLANLLIAFNMTNIIGPYSSLFSVTTGLDLSNRYFGVSDLIYGLRNIDKNPIGSFVSSVGNYQNAIYSNASKLMENYRDLLSDTTSLFGNGNFLDVLKGIATALFALVNMVGSFFTYTWGFIVMIFYYILLVFSLTYTILFWVTGIYSTELPSTITMATGNLCITPLLTAI